MKLPRPWWRLVNGLEVDALPAASVGARGNHDARQIAGARWLLRRKRDGRYLATLDARGSLRPMHHQARRHDPGIADILAYIDAPSDTGALPVEHLLHRLELLGIPADYGTRHGLALVAEPAWLAFGGYDRFGRPLWLETATARAWRRMQSSAFDDGEVLQAISGFRSHDYQLGIFRRKLGRGQSVTDILAVNAAPGYSEHHSGCALDIGCRDEPPAEESFEETRAFRWLVQHAGRFGFVMSYPRDNPHGINYEPWHWCFQRAENR